MDQRKIPWKAEWKAAGLDPGPLCPEEEAWVPRLQIENQRFLLSHPMRPASRGRPGVIPWLSWGVPLVAAALLVLLPLSPPAPSKTSLERIKGATDVALIVYRQGHGGAEKLAPRATVRPGDVLQAAYRVSKAYQGALLSLDGDGNVTVHLAHEGRSTALVPGAEHPLDFSYELDRAPKFEVFFLFTSDQPFELEPIRQTLKRVAWDSLVPGAFGPGIQVTTLALTKAVTP